MAQKGCKCTYTVFAQTFFQMFRAEMVQLTKQKNVKCSNKSRFRQNLGLVFIYHLYYVLEHPFMQKKAILAKMAVTLLLHQADDMGHAK